MIFKKTKIRIKDDFYFVLDLIYKSLRLSNIDYEVNLNNLSDETRAVIEGYMHVSCLDNKMKSLRDLTINSVFNMYILLFEMERKLIEVLKEDERSFLHLFVQNKKIELNYLLSIIQAKDIFNVFFNSRELELEEHYLNLKKEEA